ncbi:hypothetical protein TSOC_000885 [Tetrabaena socialis]|uniref:Helix-turn-helix domain-containing protein n=1 Tax=Tetrabaena socialis TaxID=47790 RepID=A0A2J8AI50_9CHLO|nr:hypothetical protein TSOC_000885 [Tetrabaena socialis]|eukprot:PNH12196.1 hypothetical protein TSOC_000885 [Tetrabaena socialis]
MPVPQQHYKARFAGPTNYVPPIANLFLAWYEFEFLQQYSTFAPVDIPDDSTAAERTAQEAQNERELLRPPSSSYGSYGRFIHFTSNVNEAAKRIIFISQFRRLQRIILDIDKFILEIAHLIVTLLERGYLQHRLLRQCADQLFFQPQLFLVQRRTPAYRDFMVRVRRAVHDLVSRKRRLSA